MGFFDRRKDKKVAPVGTDKKQTTDDKLQAEYRKIMNAAKEEERAAEARQEEAVRYTVEMRGRLSQLDNSPGHKRAMDVASEQAKKLFGEIFGEEKTKVEDGIEFEQFSFLCGKVTNIKDDISIRTMFSRFQALKEAKLIDGIDVLMSPFALDMALRKGNNPGQVLNDFMSKKLKTGITRRDIMNVKQIYSASLVAESIGLVSDHKTTFSSMYDPKMEEPLNAEMGHHTLCHPLDDMIIHLSLVGYQSFMERKGLKVADYTRRGIDKGVGTEEVQQAKSTIKTAMLNRDPNKEDRNVK